MREWSVVPRGQKQAFYLDGVPRADGQVVRLPVLVVQGQHPGKTLLVSAGVHGDEWEGMCACRRLFEETDPTQLAGTLVTLPVVNPPAYEAGNRTNPDDNQDMARIFPGDPTGTVTEQLAHTLSEHFIGHADFYCDLHSAGQRYLMPPLVGYQLQPEPLLTWQREAALAFGMPIVWGTIALPGRSLSAAAAHGVPALYTETTGGGQCRSADVEQYVQGLRRLMHHLGMTEEAGPGAPPPQFHVEDNREGAGHLQVQNRSPIGGYFVPEVELLARLEQGQRVGTVCDPLGKVLHTVNATCSGIVVFLRSFPRVHAGDPLCMVMDTTGAM